MATSTPNLVKISQIAAELWRFSFFNMAAGRILDFVTGQKWRNSTLRTVHVYHYAKFGDNISNGGRIIAIFRFSKWRPAAILDFVIDQKWHHGTLRAHKGHQYTKFGEDISNSGWVMAIFLFAKWRPVAILDFVTGQKWCHGRLRTVTSITTPNLVIISQMAAELLWFSVFQNGGLPPSCILL